MPVLYISISKKKRVFRQSTREVLDYRKGLAWFACHRDCSRPTSFLHHCRTTDRVLLLRLMRLFRKPFLGRTLDATLARRRNACGSSAASSSTDGRTSVTQDSRHDLEALNRFTSGRWLWNKQQQFACRNVKFGLSTLVQIAASAVGARSCTHVLKISEGQYNKVLQLTMDDGRDIIAKLPNPNAGRPHFTTASEVATMDFVCFCALRDTS